MSYRSSSRRVVVKADYLENDGRIGDKDNIHDDVERLLGGNYDDVLVGGPNNNYLNGGPGADQMWGGEGSDTLEDRVIVDGVLVADPVTNNINGGSGNDYAVLDNLPNDPVATDCESVYRGP